MLLHYLRKCRHSIISLKMLCHCIVSFKQSLLDFFKLVDSRIILVLLYDSQVRKSDVERFRLCCIPDAVLLKDKIIIRNVFGSY